jgi:UTP:GlnB (protein PII) uridylyltransferase
MNPILLATENYPFLAEFRLLEDAEDREQHLDRMRVLLRENQSQEDVRDVIEHLALREQVFARVVAEYHREEREAAIQANLSVKNSFHILARNTYLLDAILAMAFEYSLEDLPAIRENLVEQLRKEIDYKHRMLPEKREKCEILKQELGQYSKPSTTEMRQLQKYYQRIYDDQMKEVSVLEARLEELRESLPQLEKCELSRDFLLGHMVVFARGGYGRAELSFASDRDLGYCVDTQSLNAGETETCRQLIMRMEYLLREAGVQTAHQYFEIDEDLSRFSEPNSVHTIPSILESRVLLGSQSLSEALKRRFFHILPYEPYVLNKLEEYQNSHQPTLNEMDIKEDFGGLRTLQVPLWIAAATYGVFPSQTADLLALMIQKRILSPRQGYKLCQALEFLYDLRNFSGAAHHYYDEEAKASGCVDRNLESNVINDSLERLYLLKRRRFRNVDEFDRYRLQMVDSIRALSRMMLRKLMDRTVVRTFSEFQLVVHLRKRRIVEIHALEGLPQVPLALIFSNPIVLLELFIYIGQSGYDLSVELKDELAELIPTLTQERIQVCRGVLYQKFTELMLTPNTASALRVMFEISDPISESNLPDTLIGRYIPECNQMRFLLRNLSYHQHPVCIHSLNAVERCQEELKLLRQNYPELHHYLKPQHVLALKWGMLFHDVGKIDPTSRHQISGTLIAVQALERLGYQDPELFRLVSLLIAHHMTVVQLSKTSAYFDQALQNFFEVADRSLVNVILLFLVNISDYSAVSESNARDTRHLRLFFEETYRVFSEMRSSGEDSLDFIHSYLDNKKSDLEFDTRIDLLIKRSLHNDLDEELFGPLAETSSKERDRLRHSEEELRRLWRVLKVGSLDSKGIDQHTDQMIRMIRQTLNNSSIMALTESFNFMINWFFTAFPNRFLLSAPPDVLAQNLSIFQHIDRPVLANVLTNARGWVTGLLIYVRGQEGIHSRVAYVLNKLNLNVDSAKMNRICFHEGNEGYCYFFEVSRQGNGEMIFPRDIESAILRDSPPPLRIQPSEFRYNTRVLVEYLDDDEKGYLVSEQEPKAEGAPGHFSRRPAHYLRVKITVEDAPMVYFKMAHAFEAVNVPIQQSLITTTGHQVMDMFYINPEDLERLQQSDFEEILRNTLSVSG